MPAGASIVVLDDAIVSAPIDQADVGLTLEWQCTPGHGKTAILPHVHNRVWARPLAPVHVKAEYVGPDITFSWVRRARLDADSWVGDVPLDEPQEQYIFGIYDGANIVRSLTAGTSSVTYEAADIAADFPGGLPYPLQVAVSQVNSAQIAGRARRVLIYISS